MLHPAIRALRCMALLGSSLTTFALLPNIRPKLPYDALRDFEPVSMLALQPFALAVHPSLPATE